ncbi:putative fungal-specific transcription factor [Aspergillus pseudoustus]|uniref:Fungal-specific transcription factor n=1 Tax=Aspergillus pseudoustus TaxID=1810923 RepID=A0ABR4JRI7_9EURO
MPPERKNQSNQRNRPRVPEAARKRAAQACLPCRYHKEKCGGGVPCARCQKYNRTCRFESTGPQISGREEEANTTVPSESMPRRDALMMRIVRHFMGEVSFDPDNLQRIADGLDSDIHTPRSRGPPESDDTILESFSLDPLSTSTMHYSGELSHWNFSVMLRRRLQSLGDGSIHNNHSFEATSDIHRAPALHSSASAVASALMYFPPRQIAEFLLDTFLQFAQTNYYYFDESTFRMKMDYYYSHQHPLTIHDAGWLCTLLMTFAIGTQFAYMQTEPSNTTAHIPPETTDDRIGLELYRFSCRLIPDMICVASVETVQGFLLLGVYTLPIDTLGLAYTYYGLAIKMAIQNGMHRNSSGAPLDSRTVEWRNRLWWSAYSLESRISILHGRPISVSRSEVDADLPSNETNALPFSGVSNLLNVKANIYLTEQLGKLAHAILRLRRCRRGHRPSYFQQLMKIRSQLREWWSSLPTEVHCRDLKQNGPLFRCNVHLELSYTTAIIFMSRPFVFSVSQQQNPALTDTDDIPTGNMQALVTDCLEAAVRIIELCQLLQVSVGLARVSYTEFSSCRAALLALIAQSLNQQSSRVRDALSQGMGLIRQMCPSVESARSDVAVIEALECASRRLHRQNELQKQNRGSSTDNFAYSQFQRWAQLWKTEPGHNARPGNATASGSMPHTTTPPSFDGFFSSFPQELNAFAAIPGSEDELQFDVAWLDEAQIPVHPAEAGGNFNEADYLL